MSIMASSEDEETAAWEREQISRGTQSRRQFSQSAAQVDKKAKLFDIEATKRYIHQCIRKQESKIEQSRKDIAVCKIDAVRSEKKIAKYNADILKLQSSQPFFDKVAEATDVKSLKNVLDSNKAVIDKLPDDQKEFVSELIQRIDQEDIKEVVLMEDD